MTTALEHGARQPPAWAELKRVILDPHPRGQTLGESEQVSVIAAAAYITAATQISSSRRPSYAWLLA